MPDPDDVRAGAVDLGGDRVLLLGVGELAERRRVAADDLQARVAQAQVERELDQRALVAAAVEVHAHAGRGGALAGPLHQVGPVDAVGEVVAERVHRPHERLAVGDGEVGAEDGVAQLRVLLQAITVCTAATQM